MKTIDLNQFSHKQKRFKTDYVFTTPSFIKGFGSVINIFGSRVAHVSFETEKDADFTAIRNDFRMVGQDISDSLKKLKEDPDFQF